ncbi:MAG: hypothetical protein Ct9H300mP28_28910 [Pseudomonadota bacterium]|nr:MAG: hypothetical protein Ct9H300mP28_28910 [Pseudomonadota bacterium]
MAEKREPTWLLKSKKIHWNQRNLPFKKKGRRGKQKIQEEILLFLKPFGKNGIFGKEKKGFPGKIRMISMH